MILIEDKAQQLSKHTMKHNFWLREGHTIYRLPLPVGDYVLMNDKISDVLKRKGDRNIEPKKMDFLGTYNVCVDTKFDIQELISDLCGKQHDRFRDECILAKNNNIKLYILVENKGGIIQNTDIITLARHGNCQHGSDGGLTDAALTGYDSNDLFNARLGIQAGQQALRLAIAAIRRTAGAITITRTHFEFAPLFLSFHIIGLMTESVNLLLKSERPDLESLHAFHVSSHSKRGVLLL